MNERSTSGKADEVRGLTRWLEARLADPHPIAVTEHEEYVALCAREGQPSLSLGRWKRAMSRVFGQAQVPGRQYTTPSRSGLPGRSFEPQESGGVIGSDNNATSGPVTSPPGIAEEGKNE